MKTGRFLTPHGVRTICTVCGLIVTLAFTASLAFGVWP
jgi:hypothetical protein